ncbi:TrkA family potassium uptake protein [Neisseriaceae bacterium TC5R-5]|nr:TrkA family potassium uptake protein [Neisseriaceae bacterium TC5R-5]
MVVIGLGRFGSSVSQSLMRLGHEVMGVDKAVEPVQLWAETLTHAVQADASNVNVMKQLGVADFTHAIVSMGSDLAASLMTIVALTELGVKDIWVKAMTTEHGHIAQRIGAHHVVYPEVEMGERVAHLITGTMMDFIEFDGGFAVAEIHVPGQMINCSLAESDLREKFGVTVVAVKHLNEGFEHAKSTTVVLPDDLLIVSGPVQAIERLAGDSKA